MVRKLVRIALALLVPALVVPTLLAGVVAVRVCTEPLDVTSVRQRVERRLEQLRGAAPVAARPARVAASSLPVYLPQAETLEEFVEDVLRSDVARYWFHVALGKSLEVARCNPAASGLQWFKSAAHACTERQVVRAAAGIDRDLARSSSPDSTRGVLCEWARAGMAPAQATAIERAGVRC